LATRQQADRFLARLRKSGGAMEAEKERPLIFRNDVDVYLANTKLTSYWIKILVHGNKGGINAPIDVSELLPEGARTKQVDLIRLGTSDASVMKGCHSVYLSISPNTGSHVPMMTRASCNFSPTICRLATYMFINAALLIFILTGRGEPSLTM
jgi:hypothetical protein